MYGITLDIMIDFSYEPQQHLSLIITMLSITLDYTVFLKIIILCLFEEANNLNFQTYTTVLLMNCNIEL